MQALNIQAKVVLCRLFACCPHFISDMLFFQQQNTPPLANYILKIPFIHFDLTLTL